MRFRFIVAGLALVLSWSCAHASLPDFTTIVDQVSPAVVNIEATGERTRSFRQGGPDDEEVPEFFRRFFGDPEQMDPRAGERVSRGSGFVIDAEGYILTNHHVVEGASDVVVRLSDRRELKAKVIGSDEATDVALLKVEASGLPAVRLGKSEVLRPGQWVLAIGSPFNFDYSVTAGIVSAMRRNLGAQYVPFIQTDVPINQGNSGGPLINMNGEVVGINSQIFSNTGGYMGLSFAIPIEVASSVSDQLRATGTVSRGLLGVGIQDVSRELAELLGLEKPMGALVNRIESGSAADKAGIELRDVIVEFDGKPIDRFSDLPPMVGSRAPGSKIELVVVRDGERKRIKASLGGVESASSAGETEGAKAESASPLGVAVRSLDAEQREQLGLGDGEGVMIERVDGRAAQRAGLRPGDVVLMVDKTPIGTAAEFRKAIEAKAGKASVALLVRRGGSSSFVVVPQEPRD